MRIGLNLLHVVPGRIGGAETWIINFLTALAKEKGDNQYIVYTTRRFAPNVLRSADFDVVSVSLPPQMRPLRMFWEQAWLPIRLKRDRVDVVHSFANAPLLFANVPQVVTIYDLRFILYPEQFRTLKRIYRTWVVRQTVEKASQVVAISQFTKDSLVRLLHVTPDKVSVIQLPVEDFFRPAKPSQIERFRKQYDLPDKFFLYVANTYPNKNHVRLLKAFANIRSVIGRDYYLVFRGEPDIAESEVQSAIARYNLSDAVIRIPRLRREELPLLYSAAIALVFPSLFEGLGIPILEAMACGCPVIASNTTAISEILGDAAGVFINPLDVDEIGAAMVKIAKDKKLRDYYASKGLQRVKSFTFDRMADQILQVYHHVVDSELY